jgi:hypothetical protein
VGTAPEKEIKIIGASWTWHPEEHSASGNPILYDHSTPSNPSAISVSVTMRILVDNVDVTGSLSDDGYSKSDVKVLPGQQIKYQATFNVGGSINSILLATPVLDDVTLYYQTSARFLSYAIE